MYIHATSLLHNNRWCCGGYFEVGQRVFNGLIYESKGGPYFFRLQRLSSWEVGEHAQWQLVQQTRVQSTFYLTAIASITFVITGGGAKITKHAVPNHKDKIVKYLK